MVNLSDFLMKYRHNTQIISCLIKPKMRILLVDTLYYSAKYKVEEKISNFNHYI